MFSGTQELYTMGHFQTPNQHLLRKCMSKNIELEQTSRQNKINSVFKIGRLLEAWSFLPITSHPNASILQKKKKKAINQKKQKVTTKNILLGKGQQCCRAIKIWYIIQPIKLIVKDELQSELFYLFYDVPPKYISSMHKKYIQ